METKFKGIIVDVFNRKQFRGEIKVINGKIESIIQSEHNENSYILPGFIDSHVHIESSMLTPSSFAKMVVKRGTVAVVSDPHEIANVLGIRGIDYMIDDAKNVPLKIFFGVPSCVPATPLESSGAILDSDAVDRLLARDDMYFMAEMMNFPGVIHGDAEVMKKLHSATSKNKMIDGHAPGLRGEDLEKYINSGISTDHECFSYEEASQKLNKGMKILIREGSAARNFDTLYNLIDEYPNQVMLCTDDSHPDTLKDEGHIDRIIQRGIQKGLNIYNLLFAACINPVLHYGLNVGLLRIGDYADFIVVDDLTNFHIKQTIINGIVVFENSRLSFNATHNKPINNFHRKKIEESVLRIKAKKGKIKVIVATDGELITGVELCDPKIHNGNVVANTDKDILKLVVMSRYNNEPVQIGFVKGIGLREGAIASSIAHDSHNIIAVGAYDEDIIACINCLIENKGGIVVGNKQRQFSLELEIAGLMTSRNGDEIAEAYKQINKVAKNLGSKLSAPFMTISFLSLLVIPQIKLGDKGLFDVNKFEFVDLFEKI